MEGNLNFPVINKGAKCFSTLSAEELNELIKHKTQVNYCKGDMLFKQGAFSSGIMFVLDGFVKEFIEGPNSKRTSLRIVGAGDFLALSTLFSSDKMPYSISAVTDVTICLFDKDFILNLIKTNAQ
ncbi:MAG: Crp/Fnr family transcriptional regulator, partial [Bacteroidales bacterium]